MVKLLVEGGADVNATEHLVLEWLLAMLLHKTAARAGIRDHALPHVQELDARTCCVYVV